VLTQIADEENCSSASSSISNSFPQPSDDAPIGVPSADVTWFVVPSPSSSLRTSAPTYLSHPNSSITQDSKMMLEPDNLNDELFGFDKKDYVR
jgi:hypothetical protein